MQLFRQEKVMRVVVAGMDRQEGPHQSVRESKYDQCVSKFFITFDFCIKNASSLTESMVVSLNSPGPPPRCWPH